MNYILKNQQTERLTLRLLQESDFDAWLPLFEVQKQVAKFLGMDPKLGAKKLCEQWFEKCFDRYENNLGGMNVLINTKTDELIGQSGLLVQTVEDIQRLEVAYSVLPEFWGQGYATEAAQKCKTYAFENNFSDSLISIVHVENKASEIVALKNGMELEKKIDCYYDMPVNIFRIDK